MSACVSRGRFRAYFGLLSSVAESSLKLGRVRPRQAGASRLVRLRHLGGRVGRVRRVVEEERLAARRVGDEVRRLLAQHVGGVLIDPVAVELGRAPVGRVAHRQRVVVVPLRAGLVGAERQRGPVVPARRHVRDVRHGVLVEVLAEQPGVVAAVVQPGRQRGALFGLERGEATVRRPVRVHVGAVRVLPGQDRRPAGAARGVDHEGVGEVDALIDQVALDGGHVDHLVPALVVGQDQDDVGGRRGGRVGIPSRPQGPGARGGGHRPDQGDGAGGQQEPAQAATAGGGGRAGKTACGHEHGPPACPLGFGRIAVLIRRYAGIPGLTIGRSVNRQARPNGLRLTRRRPCA